MQLISKSRCFNETMKRQSEVGLWERNGWLIECKLTAWSPNHKTRNPSSSTWRPSPSNSGSHQEKDTWVISVRAPQGHPCWLKQLKRTLIVFPPRIFVKSSQGPHKRDMFRRLFKYPCRWHNLIISNCCHSKLISRPYLENVHVCMEKKQEQKATVRDRKKTFKKNKHRLILKTLKVTDERWL